MLIVGPAALRSAYVRAEWEWALTFGKPINPVLRQSDIAETPAAQLPPEAEAVLRHCGDLPLALARCGAMAHDGTPWNDLAAALADAELDFPEHDLENYPHRHILAAFKLSVDRLEENQRPRFAELCVFPPDETIPEETVLTLWRHTGQMSERRARQLLTTLARKSLLHLDGAAPNRRVSLHDLISGSLKHLVEDERELNERLLQAYAAKCTGGWATGPNDGYFYTHLHRHLQ